MPAKVTCLDCGYLAVRDEYTESTCEAIKATRTTGWHQSSMGNSTPADLFCYKTSPAFPITDGTGQDCSLDDLHVLQLRTEIECATWIAYYPGKSPKEHEEMSVVEQMRCEQLAFQQQERRRADEWRAEDIRLRQQFEALYETRHQENRGDLERHHQRTVAIAIFSAVAAAAAAIVALVALLK